MNDLQGLRVLVAGAGAIGSVTALVLRRCGADVALRDPAAVGDNASGVAAGMLAPAFETLLDPVSADHFPLLAVARDLWLDLADTLPGGADLIDRSGALYLAADEADLERRARALAMLDPACEVLGASQATALSPGLKGAPGLFTALDWRLAPSSALAVLHRAFVEAGGRLERGRVEGADQAAVDVVVYATGAAGLPAVAPEGRALQPIKGQIVRFDGAAPVGGPVVRAPGVYVCPSAEGAAVGATMQAGVNDRAIDPATTVSLQGAASALFPALATAIPRAQAGVRAATPDGLPLAGPSRAGPKVILATGARRNGWLLAPAMADVVAARLRGLDAGVFGQAFDPDRFGYR
ncbi:MAG TPA: FAD-dependent oxidoreductase [Caulobacteraceae bacterium]|nr:FAD-dependent oxidoreductase [Caulobacteraceae bacterium]